MSSSGCSSIFSSAWRRILIDSLALLAADVEAVPAVAHRAALAAADGDVELELGIDGVGVVLAQVPLHAGGAEVRPDEAPVHGLFRADHGDVGEALDEDVVERDEAVELGHRGLDQIEEALDLVGPALGHVEGDAADAVVVVGQASAAELLDEVVDGSRSRRKIMKGVTAPMSIAMAPRAMAWLAMRLSSQEMTRRYCARLGTLMSISFSQADRPALVGEHRRHVVDAVGVGHVARVRAALADLLDAAVQVAHVRARPCG
jgi:hypothetical protein